MPVIDPSNPIVVLTGAGISKESGLETFRDADGIWSKVRIEDVATPEAFARDPARVHAFYNARRQGLLNANVQPNPAHVALARLERDWPGGVLIVTQNIDDLHERGGSTRVLHLHGEIRKARSTSDERLVVNLEGSELCLGDCGPDGAQLRPHIVWFGEAVPLIEPAMDIVASADIVVVVGTSLQVYPAAGLVGYAPSNVPIHVIDPNTPMEGGGRVEIHACGAVEGLTRLESRWSAHA